MHRLWFFFKFLEFHHASPLSRSIINYLKQLGEKRYLEFKTKTINVLYIAYGRKKYSTTHKYSFSQNKTPRNGKKMVKLIVFERAHPYWVSFSKPFAMLVHSLLLAAAFCQSFSRWTRPVALSRKWFMILWHLHLGLPHDRISRRCQLFTVLF